MVNTAYLRVYQPAEAFVQEDVERWVNAPHPEGAPSERLVSRRWLVSAALPEAGVWKTEGAFVRRVEGRIFLCPWRTRLRMLTSLLAFRQSIPEEVAEAFVPEVETRRATQELKALRRSDRGLQSHIVHSNWHVPLRWFVAFDDCERVLLEDKDGLRIRYETTLNLANARLRHASGVLAATGLEEGIGEAVGQLLEWLQTFGDEGLLELDYASVAGSFPADDLVDDRSAADVWACLDALEQHDLARAGRIFVGLVDRWNDARVREAVN